MNDKQERIARLMREVPAGEADPCYRAYFEQFNRSRYYEAHEVLEHLWLKDRQGPNGSFYKGLIQLAGAFVHLQRERLRPAAALFKLAEANLRNYPSLHEQLPLPALLTLIGQWRACLEKSNYTENPLLGQAPPLLRLQS
jgi:predicted metal-dependent hydrolase